MGKSKATHKTGPHSQTRDHRLTHETSHCPAANRSRPIDASKRAPNRSHLANADKSTCPPNSHQMCRSPSATLQAAVQSYQEKTAPITIHKCAILATRRSCKLMPYINPANKCTPCNPHTSPILCLISPSLQMALTHPP